MSKEYKIVHFSLFRPHNSLFKEHRNKKASCRTIKCCNSEKCGLFARGECSYIAPIGWSKCAYGTYHEKTGFTPRARNYYKWLDECEKEYEGIKSLKQHSDIMTIVGDYVFLPYAHLNMNKNLQFESHGFAFNNGSLFFLLEHFNLDNIKSICQFRPQALFGGEIRSYQKEVVPKFVQHLSEQFPELYQELSAVYQMVVDVKAKTTNVGRKALLKTLNPNVGYFINLNKYRWTWDGTYLTSKNQSTGLMIVDADEVRLLPKDGACVVVTSEDQVNENTVFLS